MRCNNCSYGLGCTLPEKPPLKGIYGVAPVHMESDLIKKFKSCLSTSGLSCVRLSVYKKFFLNGEMYWQKEFQALFGSCQKHNDPLLVFGMSSIHSF